MPTINIDAVWDGTLWTLTTVDGAMTVTGSRLMSAQRRLVSALAKVSGTAPEHIQITVHAYTSHPAMQEWVQTEETREQASRLLVLARSKRVEAIELLKTEGMTTTEIADIFGVSNKRILQILSEAQAE